MPISIHIFGDSHTKYFFPDSIKFIRPDVVPPDLEIKGRKINGGSLAGLRHGKSSLRARNVIINAAKTADNLLLAFGQVDLEIGYYYRQVIKGETLTRISYVDWLIAIYIKFLNDLNFRPGNLAIKGVNLTLLAGHGYNYNFLKEKISSRSPVFDQQQKKLTHSIGDKINPKSTFLDPHQDKLLRSIIGDEHEQNKMHIDFNNKLREHVESINATYFDIVNETAYKDNNGNPDTSLGLDRIWFSSGMNHHIVDSIAARTIHYDKLRSVFG